MRLPKTEIFSFPLLFSSLIINDNETSYGVNYRLIQLLD